MACLANSVLISASVKLAAKKPLCCLPAGSVTVQLRHGQSQRFIDLVLEGYWYIEGMHGIDCNIQYRVDTCPFLQD